MKTPIFNSLRIIPRASDFLDRKLGSRGEVFFDQATNTLRLYDGVVTGGHKLAKADLTNVANATFLAKANAAGLGGGVGIVGNFVFTGSTIDTDDSSNITFVTKTIFNSDVVVENKLLVSKIIFDDDTEQSSAANLPASFNTISVAGQVDVIAETTNDTLTFAAGTGITITTNTNNDTVTITNSGTISSTFANIAVAGQTTVVADSGNDTLTIAAGTGITVTTDAITDTVTITNTVTAVNNLTDLDDISSASLTVDKIYLPAITMLNVTNNSASAYRFDQYGSTNNPTIFVISGTTVAFNLQATGHPFQLQDNTLANISTGLIHVSTTGVVSTGSSAQNKDSGTLYWKIPASLGGVNYAYQCSVHGVMVGTITIKGIASI
jgi:hypothetical protein